MFTLRLLGLIFLAAMILPPRDAWSAPNPRRPNIIFILADDLGYNDLGCYGQQRIQTPRIDRLAREGMRFTQFYAGSTVCAPSRCVLMTGRHLGHARVRGNAIPNAPLQPEDLTIASVLQRAGYATACIGKWGLGEEGSSGEPRRHGFDYFFGYLNQTHAHNYYPTFLLRNEERVPLRNTVPNETPVGAGISDNKLDYSSDLITEEALAFIRRSKDRPFFLYYASTLPHANNEARQLGMEVPDLGPYAHLDWPEPVKGHAAMITRLDRDVGRMMDLLDELGLARNTLVVFTSDNGPHKEGGYDPDFNDSNGALRGLKRDLYDGGIRVPFLVRWPERVRRLSVSEHVGYFGDVFATLADAAGLKTPPGLDSISFLSALRGRNRQQAQHPYLYWEFYEQGSTQAVRFGRWKAVRKPAFTGQIELYNLASDPGETLDLAATQPALVTRAEQHLQAAHVPDPAWRMRAPAR